MICLRSQRHCGGFTAAELLVTLAIGGMVIGAAAIGFGTIARLTARTADAVTVTLDATKLNNFYGGGLTDWADGSGTIKAPISPSAQATLDAEDLRERFLADTQTATAVYCLARADISTFRPDSIAYTPDVDPFPDNSDKFRNYIVVRKALASSTTFPTTQRPYNDTVNSASIFVIGYNDSPLAMRVTATYEIDVLKTTSPPGFYSSVRRYVKTATQPVKLTAYYHVFHPGYNGTGVDGQPATWPTTTDKFTPLWVSFERLGRADAVPAEGVPLDRFKKARERPFYFIWWPDPNARSLGLYGSSNTAYPATDPRQAYNHMGGRTSFMFCVPQFPSL